MRLEKDSEQQWSFRDLVPFELALLREVPEAARTNGDGRAERRLFPGLFIDPGEGEDDADDWADLVHPSLRSSFETAQQRIREDLDGAMPEEEAGNGGKLWMIRIPVAHADAWLSGLNQARLSLAERFDLYDDNDEPRPLPDPPQTMEQQACRRAALGGGSAGSGLCRRRPV